MSLHFLTNPLSRYLTQYPRAQYSRYVMPSYLTLTNLSKRRVFAGSYPKLIYSKFLNFSKMVVRMRLELTIFALRGQRVKPIPLTDYKDYPIEKPRKCCITLGKSSRKILSYLFCSLMYLKKYGVDSALIYNPG